MSRDITMLIRAVAFGSSFCQNLVTTVSLGMNDQDVLKFSWFYCNGVVETSRISLNVIDVSFLS